MKNKLKNQLKIKKIKSKKLNQMHKDKRLLI